MRNPRAAALIAAALVALPGCGESEEDKVADTIQSYLKAFTEGDGEKACGFLSEDTRRAFVAQVGTLLRTNDCGRALEQVRKGVRRQALDALKEARVSNVKVDGERATATVEARGRSSRTELAKTEGDWKISDVPG